MKTFHQVMEKNFLTPLPKNWALGLCHKLFAPKSSRQTGAFFGLADVAAKKFPWRQGIWQRPEDRAPYLIFFYVTENKYQHICMCYDSPRKVTGL